MHPLPKERHRYDVSFKESSFKTSTLTQTLQVHLSFMEFSLIVVMPQIDESGIYFEFK
jgi:hypothetical protein